MERPAQTAADHEWTETSDAQIPERAHRLLPPRRGPKADRIVAANVRKDVRVTFGLKRLEDKVPDEAVESAAPKGGARIAVIEVRLKWRQQYSRPHVTSIYFSPGFTRSSIES